MCFLNKMCENNYQFCQMVGILWDRSMMIHHTKIFIFTTCLSSQLLEGDSGPLDYDDLQSVFVGTSEDDVADTADVAIILSNDFFTVSMLQIDKCVFSYDLYHFCGKCVGFWLTMISVMLYCDDVYLTW